MRHATGTPARRLPALLLVGALACGGGKNGGGQSAEGAEGGEDALATTPDTLGGATDTLVSPDTGAGVAAAGTAATSAPSQGGGGAANPPSRPSSPSGGAATPAEGPVTVTGTVRVAGVAPMLSVTLQAPDRAWQLRGGPTDEIRRLPGAEVRVTGRPGAATAGLRELDVSDYTIVAIHGQKPLVGQVERRDGNLVLATEGGTFRLEGAGELGDHVGARAWVVGKVGDGTVAVQTYGILRPEG